MHNAAPGAEVGVGRPAFHRSSTRPALLAWPSTSLRAGKRHKVLMFGCAPVHGRRRAWRGHSHQLARLVVVVVVGNLQNREQPSRRMGPGGPLGTGRAARVATAAALCDLKCDLRCNLQGDLRCNLRGDLRCNLRGDLRCNLRGGRRRCLHIAPTARPVPNCQRNAQRRDISGQCHPKIVGLPVSGRLGTEGQQRAHAHKGCRGTAGVKSRGVKERAGHAHLLLAKSLPQRWGCALSLDSLPPTPSHHLPPPPPPRPPRSVAPH
eukprot:scaffold9124_cov101-Isochrysis_galbana.AAC.13